MKRKKEKKRKKRKKMIKSMKPNTREKEGKMRVKKL